MSRNRLSDLQSPSNIYDSNTQQDGYGNYDLERNNNNLVAGEQYELQDRSSRQLGLNEFLDEVTISGHKEVENL